jgi:hypothetical protein
MAFNMGSYTAGCYGAQFRLTWDPTKITVSNPQFGSILPGDWGTDFSTNLYIRNDTLFFLSFGSSALSGSGPLVKFDVTINALPDAQTSTVSFLSSYTVLSDNDGNELPSVCGRNGAYVIPTAVQPISEAPATNLLLDEPYPNPTDGLTHVRFSLPTNAQVHAAIYNVFGQVVENLFEKPLNAGQYETIWNADKQANGVYLLKLTVNGEVISREITVQK